MRIKQNTARSDIANGEPRINVSSQTITFSVDIEPTPSGRNRYIYVQLTADEREALVEKIKAHEEAKQAKIQKNIEKVKPIYEAWKEGEVNTENSDLWTDGTRILRQWSCLLERTSSGSVLFLETTSSYHEDQLDAFKRLLDEDLQSFTYVEPQHYYRCEKLSDEIKKAIVKAAG